MCLHAIATSHGFLDGNKRTAVLAATILIYESGYRLHAIEGEDLNVEIERLVLDLVTRKRSLEDAMEWMKLRIRPATARSRKRP